MAAAGPQEQAAGVVEAMVGRAEWCVRSHRALSVSVVQLQGMRAGEIPLPGMEVCWHASAVCLNLMVHSVQGCSPVCAAGSQ